jgi:hypothetical protein
LATTKTALTAAKAATETALAALLTAKAATLLATKAALLAAEAATLLATKAALLVSALIALLANATLLAQAGYATDSKRWAKWTGGCWAWRHGWPEPLSG